MNVVTCELFYAKEVFTSRKEVVSPSRKLSPNLFKASLIGRRMIPKILHVFLGRTRKNPPTTPDPGNLPRSPDGDEDTDRNVHEPPSEATPAPRWNSETTNGTGDVTRMGDRGPRGTGQNSFNSSTRSNIANLSKSYYSDKDRYNGLPTDNFDRKLCQFEERCDQAGVSNDEKHRAFSIMLTARARDYYFDSLRGKKHTFQDMTASIKRRFITSEHKRTLLREWDNLTLNGILGENAGNPRKFCLESPVSHMHELQCGLPPPYCNDEIFGNKRLNAVKDFDACKCAYYKPVETVEGLISDLH